MAKDKLIFIVGPTASGKSELAMEAARRFDGEIICADSRTIYLGMDIGTAKPSANDRAEVPHHLLDIVNPGENFSVAEFQRLAEGAISDIQRRGKLPVVVGGTGLYIDSLLYKLQFPPPPNLHQRAELEQLTDAELSEKLAQIDPGVATTIDLNNRRRVIRAIETAGMPKGRAEGMLEGALVVGIRVNTNVLLERIRQRVQEMIAHGLVAEVQQIGDKYGWDTPAMTAIGYRAFAGMIKGNITEEQASDEFIKGDISLAKKQMTWFKRNPDIRWAEDRKAALEIIQQFLSQPKNEKNPV